MLFELTDDGAGEWHHPTTGTRLSRAEPEVARHFGKRLGYLDGPSKQVDL